MRKLLFVALAPLLAGCQPLDATEGKKSASQIHHEQMQALIIPTPAAPVNLADAIAPVPVVVAPVVAVAVPLVPLVVPVVVVPPEPECVPVFRVVVCD